MNGQNLYLGKSGHTAAMSEFLYCGYNVANPEVDVGDDIFVVRDSDGDLNRVQVKSTVGTTRNYGFSADIYVPLRHLEGIRTPELYYVFAFRHESFWKEFLIIRQQILYTLHTTAKLGTLNQKGNIKFRFRFETDDVKCADESLQKYRNNWSKWPLIKH